MVALLIRNQFVIQQYRISKNVWGRTPDHCFKGKGWKKRAPHYWCPSKNWCPPLAKSWLRAWASSILIMLYSAGSKRIVNTRHRVLAVKAWEMHESNNRVITGKIDYTENRSYLAQQAAVSNVIFMRISEGTALWVSVNAQMTVFTVVKMSKTSNCGVAAVSNELRPKFLMECNYTFSFLSLTDTLTSLLFRQEEFHDPISPQQRPSRRRRSQPKRSPSRALSSWRSPKQRLRLIWILSAANYHNDDARRLPQRPGGAKRSPAHRGVDRERRRGDREPDRSVVQDATYPHGLHLRAAGGAGEQVQADAVPVRLRTTEPRPVPEPDGDPSEDLVPESPDEMEETESRSRHQRTLRRTQRLEPSRSVPGSRLRRPSKGISTVRCRRHAVVPTGVHRPSGGRKVPWIARPVEQGRRKVQ